MIAFIKKYQGVILSLILFAVTLGCGVSVMFAWFINNSRSGASGISVESDNSNIEIREVINVERYLGGNSFSNKNYYKYTDGYYYEYNLTTNSYELDENNNKKPMNIFSIYPNEKIDVTIWYRKIGEISIDAYRLCLSDFDDTDGKFVDSVGQQHSIRGIFRAGEVKEQMSYTWLGIYNESGADTNDDMVYFKEGRFSTDTVETFGNYDYYKTTFRIELCLDQYYDKLTASTNVLSEKTLIIGSIRLIA